MIADCYLIERKNYLNKITFQFCMPITIKDHQNNEYMEL